MISIQFIVKPFTNYELIREILQLLRAARNPFYMRKAYFLVVSSNIIVHLPFILVYPLSKPFLKFQLKITTVFLLISKSSTKSLGKINSTYSRINLETLTSASMKIICEIIKRGPFFFKLLPLLKTFHFYFSAPGQHSNCSRQRREPIKQI